MAHRLVTCLRSNFFCSASGMRPHRPHHPHQIVLCFCFRPRPHAIHPRARQVDTKYSAATLSRSPHALLWQIRSQALGQKPHRAACRIAVAVRPVGKGNHDGNRGLAGFDRPFAVKRRRRGARSRFFTLKTSFASVCRLAVQRRVCGLWGECAAMGLCDAPSVDLPCLLWCA